MPTVRQIFEYKRRNDFTVQINITSDAMVSYFSSADKAANLFSQGLQFQYHAFFVYEKGSLNLNYNLPPSFFSVICAKVHRNYGYPWISICSDESIQNFSLTVSFRSNPGLSDIYATVLNDHLCWFLLSYLTEKCLRAWIIYWIELFSYLINFRSRNLSDYCHFQAVHRWYGKHSLPILNCPISRIQTHLLYPHWTI